MCTRSRQSRKRSRGLRSWCDRAIQSCAALSLDTRARLQAAEKLGLPDFVLPPEPVAAQQHIVIIGSGIIALQTAYRLLRLGHRVTICERENSVAPGASSKAAGYLVS